MKIAHCSVQLFFSLTLIFFYPISGIAASKIAAPQRLTVSEGFVNPIGFYDSSPTFSWELSSAIQSQSAYSIVVASSPDLLPNKPDVWKSGMILSDQSTFVKYGGEAFSSKQRVYWQVMCWDKDGNASGWSKIANLEVGLLHNSDWLGKWISIPASELTEKDSRGSLVFRPQYFRKEIKINSKVKSARLYITSKGVYEAYINGKKVGTDVMSPGWTPFSKSISTLTYDVTDLLHKGENTIAAIVAEGWYAGRISLGKTNKTAANTPQLLCQLEIESGNEYQTIVTDTTWKVTQDGPIRTAKVYDGETYDANYELGNWSNNGYNDDKWHIVATKDLADNVLLLPKRYQGVKDKQVLAVQQLTMPEPRKLVFDLGQNNVGVPLLKVPMKKGDTLTIRFAEMLKPNGTLYTDNYRSALSTDYYIASKDGVIEWRPTFTFHGYRYVQLSGYSPQAQPQKDWLSAIVQYTDFNSNGSFSTSHEKLNQLQSNIVWGLRGNFFDIPTDCPQRDERLGWTGDAQVITPTAMFNEDMYAFWASYLQSMRQEQSADGSIPKVIPSTTSKATSSGWGDACVIIPWELYFRTGDVTVLEDNYEMMKKWLGYYASKSKDHIVSMASYGDWLQPNYSPQKEQSDMRRGETPLDFVSTAYYARSVELTMLSARVLDKMEDARQLQLLHNSIKEAFEKKFFNGNGRTTTPIETQTQYLLALEFGLLSKDNASKAKQQLLRVIATCDNHLNTGFLGTPILPFVLDRIDEVDLMYTILFKETYPSWFFSINQGATTMWERWDSYTLKDGFHKDGMNSFNHYAYGSIGQWLYERVAGIKPIKPGYKEILIAPIPGEPLTTAAANYTSPYGKISSSWKIENGKYSLDVTVPPNTTATIIIPVTTNETLFLNEKPFSNSSSVDLINRTTHTFELKAQAGSYRFMTILP